MSRKLLRCVLGIICFGLVAGIGSGKTGELRVVHKLVGGHLTIHGNDEDVELITSSAGEGRDSKKITSNREEKKTLSQQVADGKYGLIQTEIFSKPVKRPGLLSYTTNSEVPKDNISNLGGLSKNDIWLSENHLLVIKGGTYPPHSNKQHTQLSQDVPVWPPIDDYRAPQRQVKIPKHPKVPPPFPVQLTENGPLLLLGTNASTTLNSTFGSQFYSLYPPEKFDSENGPINEYPYPHQTNVTAGETPFAISPYFTPQLGASNSTIERPTNGSIPPLFPFLTPTDILAPLGNTTDQWDEDDPSIYYPPPYSFYYSKDNSSKVPAGPLVPGIVLPPPPDFFAPLQENAVEETSVANKSSPATSTTTASTDVKSQTDSTVDKINDIFNDKKPQPALTKNYTISTQSPIVRPYATQPVSRKKYPVITVLKPSVTSNPPVYNRNKLPVPFKTYGPPTTRSNAIISTTQVPLKAYYTTPYKLESVLATQRPNKIYLPSGRSTTTKSPARYYFYEENGTTPKLSNVQQPHRYFNVPDDYYIPAKQVDQFVNRPQSVPERQNIQYFYINGEDTYNNFRSAQSIRPTRKPDTFSIHIARLKNQIRSHQSVPNNKNYYPNEPQLPSPKPVYHYSFQAANYPNQRNVHPESAYQEQSHSKTPLTHYQVQIQEAVEVTPPTNSYENSQDNFYFRSPITENPNKFHSDVESLDLSKNKPYVVTPKTITQYSFEITPNPIYNQYYTKQDEKFIDDVTRQHFTVFGQKLPVATTPIPHTNKKSNINQFAQSNPSFERNTLINYIQPQLAINSHAEYRPLPQQEPENYNTEHRPVRPPLGGHQHTYTDYRHQQTQNSNDGFRFPEAATVAQEERRTPYVTYKLPGDDGTHFYFITPQLAQKREQNASFYFSRPNISRSKRTDANT